MTYFGLQWVEGGREERGDRQRQRHREGKTGRERGKKKGEESDRKELAKQETPK